LCVPVAVIVVAPGGGRRSLCGRRGASSLLSQSVLLHPGGTRACRESFRTIARQSARASVGSAGVSCVPSLVPTRDLWPVEGGSAVTVSPPGALPIAVQCLRVVPVGIVAAWRVHPDAPLLQIDAPVGSAGVHGPPCVSGAVVSACPRGGSAVTTPCSTRARYLLDSVSRTVRDYRDMPVCAALGLIFLLVGSASCFDVGVLCFRVLDSVCAPTTVSPPGAPAHGQSVPSCGACRPRCGVASPP
jgi:hypothetical protein